MKSVKFKVPVYFKLSSTSNKSLKYEYCYRVLHRW